MNSLQPRIEVLAEKKLVGKHLKMSMSDFRVTELWRSFIPLRKSIAHVVSSELISLAVYAPGHFLDFDPNREFEKWAGLEVLEWENIPDGLEAFKLKGGEYAVFDYKGSSANPSIYRYIFDSWLPQSGYELDDRPHFEILGEKYKNNDPESEEEIWIPIKKKG